MMSLMRSDEVCLLLGYTEVPTEKRMDLDESASRGQYRW
jgi:hypothetical protein